MKLSKIPREWQREYEIPLNFRSVREREAAIFLSSKEISSGQNDSAYSEGSTCLGLCPFRAIAERCLIYRRYVQHTSSVSAHSTNRRFVHILRAQRVSLALK